MTTQNITFMVAGTYAPGDYVSQVLALPAGSFNGFLNFDVSNPANSGSVSGLAQVQVQNQAGGWVTIQSQLFGPLNGKESLVGSVGFPVKAYGGSNLRAIASITGGNMAVDLSGRLEF
jgi:hypothetical protein